MIIIPAMEQIISEAWQRLSKTARFRKEKIIRVHQEFWYLQCAALNGKPKIPTISEFRYPTGTERRKYVVSASDLEGI